MNYDRNFDINLLNHEIRDGGRTPLWESKSLYLLVIALIVMIWAGACSWYALRERCQKTKINKLQEKMDLAASDQRIESQAAVLKKELAKKEADIQKIEGALILNSEVLTQIETAVPPGINLTDISANGNEMTCKGAANDYPTLATFIVSADKRKNLTEARCLIAETTDKGIRFELLLKLTRK